MFRSALLKSLLVVALLFAQLGGLAHGISHTLAAQSHDQSLPHDNQCDLCAAYAQIGSALGSSDVHFDFSASFTAAYEHTHENPLILTLAAYAARAPPRSA